MPNNKPLAERIKNKIEVRDTTGCWLWKSKKLYYQFPLIFEGKRLDAKKIIYRIYNSTIPAGFALDNQCSEGHSVCVNPMHQELVPTRAINPRSKVTAREIKEIISKIREGYSYRKLGREYGVSRQTILNIRRASNE